MTHKIVVYLFKDCQDCYRWGNARSKAEQIEKKFEVPTQMDRLVLQEALEGMHAWEGGPDDAVHCKQPIEKEESTDGHDYSRVKSSRISDAVVDFSVGVAEEGAVVNTDSFCVDAELEHQENAATKGEDCFHYLEEIYIRDDECCDNHLNCKITPEVAAAVLQLLLEGGQVPIRLKLVPSDQLLSPGFLLFGVQDAVAHQQGKELVLDSISLPHLEEDLFDGKKSSSGSNQDVREVEHKPVDLNQRPCEPVRIITV